MYLYLYNIFKLIWTIFKVFHVLWVQSKVILTDLLSNYQNPELGMVAHTYNPTHLEAEAGGS